MVIFKKISLLSGILIYIPVCLSLHIFLFILSAYKFLIISQLTRIFSRFLRLILKIKVVIEGNVSLSGKSGTFIVSNHLGYLDGIILGSLFNIVYTSKTEVKSWPLFGWMTRVGGTVFIDRKNKGKVSDYIQETVKMLKNKVNVLVFPEGTSGNGQSLLPFQTIHFESPLIARSSILPISIIYTKINKEAFSQENRDKVCWYGQVKFYQHLSSVLRLNSIEARVIFHPGINLENSSGNDYSRKTLSESLHKVIAANYPLCKH